MKYIATEVYENDEGNRLYDVKIEDKTIKGLKAIKINKEQCQQKCKYKSNCSQYTVRRTFDCKRNVEKLQNVFNWVTTPIVLFIFYMILRIEISSFSGLAVIFIRTAILLFSLTLLDIACTFVEGCVPKIYHWVFYKNMKKLQKIQRKEEELAEAQRKVEEAEKIANAPNYKKVKEAKVIVEELRELSEQHNYGPSEEKINVCVEKCEVIVQKLEEDSSGYVRVMDLFEVYLPEFCNALAFYTNFLKADAVTETHENVLTECVDVILQFLEGQRVKAIFDKDSIETQFQASAEALKSALEREIEK